MKTKLIELPDCYLLMNRISIYIITFDSLLGWTIQHYGNKICYYFGPKEKFPMAVLGQL